jgi:hypothetical protein
VKSTIFMISTLALMILFVVGCGTYESISDAIVEATQNTIVQENPAPRVPQKTEIVRELAYASEHRVDIDTLTIEKGNTLSLWLASSKDSYFSLGNDEFMVKKDGAELMKFVFEKEGTYKLECLFNCEQADLAREMTIIVE